jgi:hypothetical protein
MRVSVQIHAPSGLLPKNELPLCIEQEAGFEVELVWTQLTKRTILHMLVI